LVGDVVHCEAILSGEAFNAIIGWYDGSDQSPF
jgi:hypothetical protein